MPWHRGLEAGFQCTRTGQKRPSSTQRLQWCRAAKTGKLHSGSYPSSIARDNVVLRTDEHVGGPPPSH